MFRQVRPPVLMSYAAFVLVGISVGISGVLLPSQMAGYGVDRATIGITFFTGSAGFVLASVSTGALIQRAGIRIALTAGGGAFVLAGLYLATRPPFAAFMLAQLIAYDELVDPFAAEAGKRDNSTIFPGVAGGLCASHPRTCQALADDAGRSGAEVISGAAQVRVQPGKRPSVTFRDGKQIEVRPRLVIGADGRTSTVRKQSGIRMNRIPATHVATGLLVEGAGKWPADQYSIGVEGDCMFFVFPQGDGRLRLYICHANEQAARWAGRAGARRFIEAFARLRAIPESLGLSQVTPAGPCGTFGGDQTWCDEPCADGVVLAGDAGGYDNPVDGQGLSLALRDVRALSELLLSSADWTTAGLRPYARQRAERLRRMRRVSTTYAEFMTTFTDAGRARRARLYAAGRNGRDDLRLALSAIFAGPDRLPAAAFTDQLHEAALA